MQQQGDSSRAQQGGAAVVIVDGDPVPADEAESAGEYAAEQRLEPREVVDGDGVRWRVYERAGPAGPARRERWYLVFDSAMVVRRVSSYPAAWRELPPGDLLAVSWGR